MLRTDDESAALQGRPLVLFTGAQHGFNTDNTSLCGTAAGAVCHHRHHIYMVHSAALHGPNKGLTGLHHVRALCSGITDPVELEANPYDDYSFTFAQPIN